MRRAKAKHALSPTWPTLRPHKQQSAFWRTRAKFIHIAAGRGSGKTECTRRRQIRWLPVKYKGIDQPLHAFALPTYRQAKRVAWEPLLKLIPRSWIHKVSYSELTVETVFGSKLYVLGLDKPERAEGVQWSTFVIDESCDQKPGVFDRSILPALSHNCDWCARIGVPKRFGPGALEFRLAWEKAHTSADPNSVSFGWPSSDIVDPEIIAWAQENLAPEDYDEQYNANWLSLGGGVYYGFDPNDSVCESAEFKPDIPIGVGSDFNVDPMAWVLGQKVGRELHIFNEIVKRNTNTRKTLDHLFALHGTHSSGWMFTGDASGRARKTSASKSDYLQIYNDSRFINKRVQYAKKNSLIADRVATVNAGLDSFAGIRKIKIHPRCTTLIGELDTLGYKKGTREIDDVGGSVGHVTDAFGYLCQKYIPMEAYHGVLPEISISTG